MALSAKAILLSYPINAFPPPSGEVRGPFSSELVLLFFYKLKLFFSPEPTQQRERQL